MGKRDKLRIIIRDLGLHGGLPTMYLLDVVDHLEDLYLKRWRYRISLTPKILGQVLGEFKNVEKIYIKSNGNTWIKVRIHAVDTTVHKCQWKKYDTYSKDGKYKKCTICGLILHDKEQLKNFIHLRV